ncbi:MAG TPA: DUF4136 domain-containing protein [Bacteroidales bacterium]|nr:DUF4136 domain-containing protein [Bacteroidales bacterium]HRX98267.1 DUF4136 domain-containing protein [Bacteroidales bacterium]
MKKQNLILLPVLFILTGLLTSCSSLRLSADYDKTVDFSKYKTIEFYGWAKESDKLLNGMDKTRIEDAFANEFYKRGMSLTRENGDLVVTLYIVIADKSETTAHTTNMGYGGYYGGYYGYGPGWGWGPNYSTTTVSTYNYKEGTLICSVYDKANERLIWEGIASKTIDENPSNRERNIPKIVAMLMKKYPVEPVASK